MPESESFDAFYARTVQSITSQMHALGNEDGLADHAIREAYARAYQQWYEVSGYRDSEAWVLRVAKDAYQRRRAEAGALRDNGRAPGHDPLSLPGMFRPAPPKPAADVDPEATLTPQGVGATPTSPPATSQAGTSAAGISTAGTGTAPTGQPATDRAAADVPPGSLFGSPAPGGVTASPAADWFSPTGADRSGPAPASGAATPDATPGWGTPAGATPTSLIADDLGTPPKSARSWTMPSASGLPPVLRSRRNLIALGAAAVILLAGVIVYATGGQGPRHPANPGVSASAVAKPTVHMLPAGRTGDRASIPWSIVATGWTLAEVSTAQPDANGAAVGGGRYVTYLVDPEGGRYRDSTTSGGTVPTLLAWSGDARKALYALGGGSGGASSYRLLWLDTGQLTTVQLPAGATPLGFTRPDGFNILGIRQKQGRYLLQRYNLSGTLQATIGSMPRPATALDVLQGNALSSPDGTTAVWGVFGHEMQLVSNAGGLIRRLRVPGASNPPDCAPISWWSDQTVLAYCNVASAPDSGRLWLVPAGGGQPSALTGISGSPSGSGDLTGALQAGGAVYITARTAAQCQAAASGPGGQQILALGQNGTETSVSLPGSTNNHATVVVGVGPRLLVLAQTSCPGTSSLIWFNPSTQATQTVLAGPATEMGVVAAVAYGSDPVATTGG
jgi:hypothetical protein